MQILIAVSNNMTILHGCEFWGVDKVKSAANFCNDHWHCILSNTQHSGGSLADGDTR